MSQSVTANRSLTFRRNRTIAVATVLAFASIIIAFPNGAVANLAVSLFFGIAGIVAIAMLPKAYAKVAPMVRKHTR